MFAYLAVMAVVVALVWQARRRAITALETPGAQANWREWRREAQRQAEGSGPVLRRIPRSDQPPELVLLRDHFWACLVGLMLLTSAVFAALTAMVRGVLRGPKFEPHPDSVSDAPGPRRNDSPG